VNKLSLQLVALSLAAAHPCLVSGAESAYPTKPVRVVVPFPAGSTTDIVSRQVAQGLVDTWGQQVIIDNRAGAGGTIGTLTVARATADGYTMLVGGTATHAITPNLHSKLDYHPLNDFAPIALMATTPYLLVVNPAVPANSVKDLVALAKAKPGALSYASGGNGSAPHLTAAIFSSMTGVDMTHVPYKGSAPAIIDLMGGRVQVFFTGIPSVLSHLRASRLKALAITSRERTTVLPELPTVAESGVPGYDVSPWFGLMAPAKTAPAILKRINADVNKTMASAELRKRLSADGVEVASGTPEQFRDFVRAELAKWGQAVKQSGMKIE
jgi:tripartite-type tricarboxylate transporter receptor subunit TctC